MSSEERRILLEQKALPGRPISTLVVGFDFLIRPRQVARLSGPAPVNRESRQKLDLVLIEFQEHGILASITQR